MSHDHVFVEERGLGFSPIAPKAPKLRMLKSAVVQSLWGSQKPLEATVELLDLCSKTSLGTGPPYGAALCIQSILSPQRYSCCKSDRRAFQRLEHDLSTVTRREQYQPSRGWNGDLSTITGCDRTWLGARSCIVANRVSDCWWPFMYMVSRIPGVGLTVKHCLTGYLSS